MRDDQGEERKGIEVLWKKPEICIERDVHFYKWFPADAEEVQRILFQYEIERVEDLTDPEGHVYLTVHCETIRDLMLAGF